MPRRIVRHEPHDFSDIPDLVFQTLIRDLLSATYPNRRVVEYGGQGSQQYGIDVLVGHKDHAVFAQVKRTSLLEPGAVRKLANDFLMHLDGYWQGWTLEAFIVAVSSKILKPQTHQALETFRKQLDLQGIPLIIWDSPVIRDLAWGKHMVFERYLDSEELIEQLCGPHVPHGGLELTVSIALGLERAYRRWAADPRTMVVAFLDDVLPHSELEAVEFSRFILALRDHPIERNRIFAGRHEGDLEQGFAALASTSGEPHKSQGVLTSSLG